MFQLCCFAHFLPSFCVSHSRVFPQEPTHFDADAALIQEDMEVMSDFELHQLCKQYTSISSYQLETDLLLDSGKFHHLKELLASLKNKVTRSAVEPRGEGRVCPNCV